MRRSLTTSRPVGTLLALLAAWAAPTATARDGCAPAWQPTFGQAPGTNAAVHALAVYDDGGGPALYVGGEFSRAGGVPAAHVARWDGARWSALDVGTNDWVTALAVYDDGGGPALYAGGRFTSAGGAPAPGVARWDGSAWSPLGAGVPGWVRALAVHDDGSGPALYAGGDFTTAGGVAAPYVARWDGAAWAPVGGGTDGWVRAFAVYDDGLGGGPALHAAGDFTLAGGALARRVARWDGAAWSGLGLGTDNTVHALVVHDDGLGGGPALYAGGQFDSAGGAAIRDLARWDGLGWSDVGGPLADGVYALAVHDDGLGGGAALYAGGALSLAGGVAVQDVARWDGAAWSALGAGVDGFHVRALASYDDGLGGGAALYAGGSFTHAGGRSCPNVAGWDGADWTPLGDGPDQDARALAVFDDGLGDGPVLFAGGNLSAAGGVALGRVGRWDGAGWTALGGGVDGPLYPGVSALAAFDDGAGPALYAGGRFESAGGVPTQNVARWDGLAWSALGSGADDSVAALCVFDDGAGPALYAGGGFTTAGGLAARGVARWDGSAWSALGAGTDGPVQALAVFDDGGGPALYAGGEFTAAGGVAASRVARWDGAAWAPLGAGVGGFQVSALAAFDDGSGPALYAGGWFSTAGGVPAAHVARWDGSSWSAVGGGANGRVLALAALDDGTGGGPALYAGGVFSSAGGQPARRVARWDGTAWSALGGGVDSVAVLALAAAPAGPAAAPTLFAAGTFTRALDSGDSYLAAWGCAQAPGPGAGYCFGDGGGAPCPCGNVDPGGAAGCANSSGAGAILDATGRASVGNDTLVLAGERLIPGQPALLFQGDAALAGGAGLPFGDGLRCAGTNVVRLAVLTPDAAGAVAFPGPGDPSLSVLGAVQVGDTRRYQLWYRDPSPPGPCGSGFNLTNGYALGWQ